jgi:hypothetical protein
LPGWGGGKAFADHQASQLIEGAIRGRGRGEWEAFLKRLESIADGAAKEDE